MKRRRSLKRTFVVIATVAIFLLLSSSAALLGARQKATRIVVDKASLSLMVLSGDHMLVKFPVGIGKNFGPKRVEGDWKTPEGKYYITDIQYPPKDAILWLSYPNDEAATWGLANRIISRVEYGRILAALQKKGIPDQRTGLGGGIAIHGDQLKNGRWTPGCVVLRNLDMFVLIWLVPPGTPVTILPDHSANHPMGKK